MLEVSIKLCVLVYILVCVWVSVCVCVNLCARLYEWIYVLSLCEPLCVIVMLHSRIRNLFWGDPNELLKAHWWEHSHFKDGDNVWKNWNQLHRADILNFIPSVGWVAASLWAQRCFHHARTPSNTFRMDFPLGLFPWCWWQCLWVMAVGTLLRGTRVAAQGPTIHSCAHEFIYAGPAVRSAGRGTQGKEEGGRGEEGNTRRCWPRTWSLWLQCWARTWLAGQVLLPLCPDLNASGRTLQAKLRKERTNMERNWKNDLAPLRLESDTLLGLKIEEYAALLPCYSSPWIPQPGVQ